MATSCTPTALLVVESPAKALTLRRWLGPGWDVRATRGHLLDLPRNREGIDLANGFEPVWELVRGQARTLSELKRAARRVERVLLATDPDREGEGIAWQLASELGAEGGSSRVARVLLGELTPEGVSRALASPVGLDRARSEAQLARRVVDRLIGYRLSARLSSALRPGLTAGRVQAAALRLAAGWEPPETGGPDASGTAAPPPFTTETLLQAAAERLHLRPRRAMALAQRLYEGVELGEGGRTGLITYPRTGSCWVSPAADLAARALVAARHGPSSVAAEAPGGPRDGPSTGHEALRPASLDWPPERALEALRVAGGRDLPRLYALIWGRFIESRMEAAGWRERWVTTRAGARPRPPRLDDAALIGALAARGVGRPSTFATIGESLEARGYLTRDAGALQVTPLGHRVVAWLDRTFPRTLDARFTASLESRLDEVEAGTLPWRHAVAAAWTPLERALARAVA
jgi:DNA topoisomerase I